MNKIETNGEQAFLIIRDKKVLIDTEDIPRINAFKWILGTNGYLEANIGSKPQRWRLSLHRLLMSFPETGVVDHVNRNTLDNRKCNLRIATKGQNRANSSKSVTAKSNFFGVYPSSKGASFRAQISIKGKVKHLGSFKDEWSAACAYDNEAFKLFGKFASLNIFL